MLLKRDILEKIAAGEVTLALRRWNRPSVKAGGRLRTAVGILAIEEVSEIRLDEIGDDDARRAGFPDACSARRELLRRDGGRFYRIALRPSGPDPRVELRERAELDPGEVGELGRALAKLDGDGPTGRWTMETLRLIGEKDGRTATELAAGLGMDKAVLKRRIRRLKELGLTESLRVGYRLSKRGRAFVDAAAG